jgi:hypothetical protein
MIYMEPGLSPGYRREEEEEGKEGLEEEEEEASPDFVDSWLRRWERVFFMVCRSTAPSCYRVCGVATVIVSIYHC